MMLSDSSLSPIAPQSDPSRNWCDRLLALERNRSAGKVSGLCQAISYSWGIDPLLLRLLFVIASFSAGLGVLLYGVGWIFTKESLTHLAPIDHISPRWRRGSPQAVLIASTFVAALIGVAVGSYFPLSYSPLIVVVITIWTGMNVTYRSSSSDQTIPSHHNRMSTAIPSALILLIAGASSLAIWDLGGKNLLVSIATFLAIIGVGLVAMSFYANPVGLILSGLIVLIAICVGLDMEADVFKPADQRSTRHSYTAVSVHDLHGGRYVREHPLTYDLRPLEVNTDVYWPMELEESHLHLLVLPTTNLIIRWDNDPTSVVHLDDLPGSFALDRDSYIWTRIPQPGKPIVEIELTLDSSFVSVEVE